MCVSIKPGFRKGGRSEAQKSPPDMAKHSDDRRRRSHPYGEEEGASRAIDGGNFQAAVDHTCEIRVKKGVIPAAGVGTRWLPFTRSVPKELLPVGPFPLIHHVVKEAVEAGIHDFLFVLSPGKESILTYFQDDPGLNDFLKQKGKEDLLDDWRALVKQVTVSHVIQEEARGLGDAVSRAHSWAENQPFAVLLPDDLVFNAPSCIGQIIAAADTPGEALVALEEVPREEVYRYGVVEGRKIEGNHIRITGVVEKPSVEEAPSNQIIIGRYILPPAIFSFLERVTPGSGGEIQLTDALGMAIDEGGLKGVLFEGRRYDAGKPPGWLLTNLAYSASDPQVSSTLEAFLRSRFS